MQAQMDTTIVRDAMLELANDRSRAIALYAIGEKYNHACDALLEPLVYQSDNNNLYYGLQLPRCFPSMTEPDVLTILEWYVSEGSIIRPSSNLLEVHSNYGDILIPMHPAMLGSYRVVQIMRAQSEQLQMGDLLIVLEDMKAQKQSKSKTLKLKVA